MKCLNTRAKLTIQKLYEAMYDPKYMIEEGVYAKIDKNPAYMPVVVEKVGHLPGYGEVISIAHYGKQNGDAMADPDIGHRTNRRRRYSFTQSGRKRRRRHEPRLGRTERA